MRERVLTAARELGYRPNPFARSLRLKRSFIIGLCVVVEHNLDDTKFREIPIITHLDRRLAGIESHPLWERYHLMVIRRDDDRPDLEERLLRSVEYLDGLIYVSPRQNHLPVLRRLARRLPLVIEEGFGIRDISTVEADQRRAIEESVELLAERGSRNLGMLLHRSRSYLHNQIRIEGFRNAAVRLGLSFDEERILSDEGGYHAFHGLMTRLIGMSPRVDGVIVPRDRQLMGAVDAIADAGLNLGSDIRLISVNETETAFTLRPGITAIQFPYEEIACQCFSLLLSQIDGALRSPAHVSIPARIIERASTLGETNETNRAKRQRGIVGVE
jgi:LacI family transcriptional regulator